MPPLAQNIRKKLFASAAGLSVRAVICTHDGFDITLGDTRLKRRKIGLVKILLGNHCIEGVTKVFGTAVNCKVLSTGCRLQILRVMPLNSFDETHTETAAQIRVFAVSLMTAAPTGITENVHVRRPECQALVNIPVAVGRLHIKLCSSFGGDDVGHLLHHIFIKSSRKTYGLRKNGCNACSGNTVKRFIPIVVRFYVKTLDCRCIKKSLHDLFL